MLPVAHPLATRPSEASDARCSVAWTRDNPQINRCGSQRVSLRYRVPNAEPRGANRLGSSYVAPFTSYAYRVAVVLSRHHEPTVNADGFRAAILARIKFGKGQILLDAYICIRIDSGQTLERRKYRCLKNRAD